MFLPPFFACFLAVGLFTRFVCYLPVYFFFVLLPQFPITHCLHSVFLSPCSLASHIVYRFVYGWWLFSNSLLSSDVFGTCANSAVQVRIWFHFTICKRRHSTEVYVRYTNYALVSFFINILFIVIIVWFKHNFRDLQIYYNMNASHWHTVQTNDCNFLSIEFSWDWAYTHLKHTQNMLKCTLLIWATLLGCCN